MLRATALPSYIPSYTLHPSLQVRAAQDHSHRMCLGLARYVLRATALMLSADFDVAKKHLREVLSYLDAFIFRCFHI